MALTRFSVSLEASLVQRFDARSRADKCPTRSKAIGDLIRASLVRTEWKAGEEVAGAMVLVYDHHQRGLMHRLTRLQHDGQHVILSTQHVHLDHHNCLEIIAVRGPSDALQALFKKLKAIKGLKHVSLAAGTTGRHLQ